MAKCGVPMPLQTHVKDNQPPANRFDWHNRAAGFWVSSAHVDLFYGGGLGFGLRSQMFPAFIGH
jgi:hypothetical protein